MKFCPPALPDFARPTYDYLMECVEAVRPMPSNTISARKARAERLAQLMAEYKRLR